MQFNPNFKAVLNLLVNSSLIKFKLARKSKIKDAVKFKAKFKQSKFYKTYQIYHAPQI
ncbi:hypothetical protein CSUNSWCD_675 [Campylobacter showae CSUNSWCD]|uniref:Uncharacterized protein n=1 Tax=Campylobacter showae CSUNSWCD TaxID=1244083 RepID=M5IPG3_9BACT|nr:hypothetical protein CSUNSWCD_675 [Campylobacter showae CSUNSWCD]